MAQGTGLPIPKSGDVLTKIPNVIDADRYSSAAAWGRIAAAGDKYAKAGTDTYALAEHQRQVGYLADQEIEIRRKRTDLQNEHALNPAGFEAAWAGYTEGKLSEAEPKLSDQIRRVLGTEGNSAYSSILNSKTARDRGLDADRIKSLIDLTGNDWTDAAKAGTLDTPDGRVKQIKFNNAVDTAVTSQLISREHGDIIKNDRAKRTTSARVAQSAVSVLTSSGSVEAAERHLRRDVLENDKTGLDAGERKAAYDAGLQAVQQAENQKNFIQRRISADMEWAERGVSQGVVPSTSNLADLRERAQQSGNPLLVQRVDALETMSDFVAAARTMRPAEVEAKLVEIEKTKGAAAALMLREVSAKLVKTMRAELNSDQLGWADRVGVQAVPPIDFAGADLAAQFRDRKARAENTAAYYGQPAVYFRPDEKLALEAAMLKGGPTMLTVAKAISAGFGDAGPRAMSEISVQAPAVAHVGNLLAGSGSVRFASDFAEATKLRADKEFKIPRWLDHPAEKVRIAQETRTREVYGDAFFLARDTGRAANEAAQAVFFARSARGSKAASPVLDSQSKPAYDRALQEAAGARFTADGRQYGGVGTYKPGFWTTFKVLVPENVRADSFGDAVGAVTDADLSAHAVPPRMADGKPYTAADLRAAVPVATAGGYRFALGDPASEDPKWIRGADGQPFVLDFSRLEPELRKRAPGAFIGGEKRSSLSDTLSNFANLFNPIGSAEAKDLKPMDITYGHQQALARRDLIARDQIVQTISGEIAYWEKSTIDSAPEHIERLKKQRSDYIAKTYSGKFLTESGLR